MTSLRWRNGHLEQVKAYNPTIEELVDAADIINDVPFAPLTEVLKWKRAFGRPKDVQDVALIEQHLRMRS
jgi:hypothetical protein